MSTPARELLFGTTTAWSDPGGRRQGHVAVRWRGVVGTDIMQDRLFLRGETDAPRRERTILLAGADRAGTWETFMHRLRLVVTAGLSLLAGLSSLAPAQTAHAVPVAVADWSGGVWDKARAESRLDTLAITTALDKLPPTADASMTDALSRLKSHIEQREKDRAARTAELTKELDEALGENGGDRELSSALRFAVELELLSPDRAAFLNEPRIVALIARVDRAAKAAEARRDWLMARELYVRLHALLEEAGTYKKDVDRLNQRLAMLMLYVPEALWKMRNDRVVAQGDDPLPPYNPVGNDANEKLRAITDSMVVAVLARAGQHVDQKNVNDVAAAGIEALITLVKTPDLAGAFPKLADQEAADKMLAVLTKEQAALKGAALLDPGQARAMLTRLQAANESSVKIAKTALLHEFGNGMMTALDEFSAIIWPDEVRRFQRNTQGRLVGIGVQIQYDAQSNIRVVAPIDGSPAQRAGFKPGDIIKKVDGTVTYGMGLDQAVDLITGPANTEVAIEVEREPGEPGGEPTIHEFAITRAVIDIRTVKGWRRTGPREDDWDYFIDKDHAIGYVRLTQFTDTTTREFDRAVRTMQGEGLSALILDLRFNPGGLLDQAVSIVQRFVDKSDAFIVRMSNGKGVISHPEFTDPSVARLAKTPVIVLVNENSASASEIVAGALRYYGKTGDIRAMVLGERSFGKGSVQNVWEIPNAAMMKLTIQYYMLPDNRLIHRRPGDVKWGVDPDVRVEMLPRQTNAALTIRRNADLAPEDFRADLLARKPKPAPADGAEPPVIDEFDAAAEKSNNPDDLLAKGIDLQLETAVVLLQSQAIAGPKAQAQR